MTRGSAFVWAIWLILAGLAYQAGVLIPAAWVSLGFVLGVAATWLYARVRLGGS